MPLRKLTARVPLSKTLTGHHNLPFTAAEAASWVGAVAEEHPVQAHVDEQDVSDFEPRRREQTISLRVSPLADLLDLLRYGRSSRFVRLL